MIVFSGNSSPASASGSPSSLHGSSSHTVQPRSFELMTTSIASLRAYSLKRSLSSPIVVLSGRSTISKSETSGLHTRMSFTMGIAAAQQGVGAVQQATVRRRAFVRRSAARPTTDARALSLFLRKFCVSTKST